MKKAICKYFLKGLCKYGDKCHYSHNTSTITSKNAFSLYTDVSTVNFPTNPANPLTEDFLSLDISDNHKNICKAFLNGKCNDPHCTYIHGYGDRLINISKIPTHNLPINNIIKISENNFITTDEKTLKIYSIEQQIKCTYTNIVNDSGRISKVYYDSNIIFIFKEYWNDLIPDMIDRTLIIMFFNENKVELELDSSFVYDMIYFDECNLLLVFGKEKIEVFAVDFMKKIFISYIKFPIENAITSQCLVKESIMVCGLENGYISILNFKKKTVEREKILEEKLNIKVHDKHINKVINKHVNDYTNYILTASQDNSVKILNYEKGLTVCYTKTFLLPVVNIFMTVDYLNNELFCIAFEEGTINVLNNEFEILFDIPSHSVTKVKRNGINFINTNKTEKEGNFFVLDDNNCIECNIWINQEYDKKVNKLGNKIYFI